MDIHAEDREQTMGMGGWQVVGMIKDGQRMGERMGREWVEGDGA